jgi:hypothetical protein
VSGKFLITGLPRSRTAWWSVATTTPASTCRHEPLKYCASFDDLVACWDGGADFGGISDHGLTETLARVLDEVKPRTLIVHRNIDDVEVSLEAYFGAGSFDRVAGRAYLEQYVAQIDAVKSHPLVRNVAFDVLGDLAVVEDCLQWLMPGNPHPFNRDLMTMNIQANKAYVLACLKTPHPQWYRT